MYGLTELIYSPLPHPIFFLAYTSYQHSQRIPCHLMPSVNSSIMARPKISRRIQTVKLPAKPPHTVKLLDTSPGLILHYLKSLRYPQYPDREAKSNVKTWVNTTSHHLWLSPTPYALINSAGEGDGDAPPLTPMESKATTVTVTSASSSALADAIYLRKGICDIRYPLRACKVPPSIEPRHTLTDSVLFSLSEWQVRPQKKGQA
ncbi:hypothetical protein CROQUDRAFT_109348 [Cronartium quercuum f. sp. fusiforme G11]|uniref:Uncharacterized protein n=1 Tax=Cronartium quercuum f. sp. fusiforme G11 TaxID=708437 RepID=A0A9P6NBW4_9BASI|nr:hypothetical protein CROQUDRAFT_109348 [Cronartium quercuum f. sp. fusiforme G11]